MTEESQEKANVASTAPVAKSAKKAAKKKIVKKTVKQARPAARSTAPGPKQTRPYPRITLEESLQVGAKIKALNGGNAWAPEEVARALDMGAKAPKFFYVTAASRDFGLTSGTRDTPKIELTELGREIVYAPNEEEEKAKKLEAFLGVEIFKKVLAHYNGSQLPEMKYLGNTLQKEFGLHPDFHEEFSRVFRQNCQDLGIYAGLTPSSGDIALAPGAKEAKGAATVVIAEPKSRSGLKAFVIMPFVERNEDRPKGFFTEVLRSLITPAAVDAGFSVETASRQGSDVIQSTIINDLLEADLVIADLTDHNPNVLFELGLRMAEDKPVALIKATGTGRIFDVDNMLRVYEYNGNLWQSTIEKDLPSLAEHIKGAWENRERHMSYIKILRRGPTAG